jgi:hypothetical protein
MLAATKVAVPAAGAARMCLAIASSRWDPLQPVPLRPSVCMSAGATNGYPVLGWVAVLEREVRSWHARPGADWAVRAARPGGPLSPHGVGVQRVPSSTLY